MIPFYIIFKNLQAFVFFHNFSKYFLIAFEKKGNSFRRSILSLKESHIQKSHFDFIIAWTIYRRFFGGRNFNNLALM
jgi:hypothetical protein